MTGIGSLTELYTVLGLASRATEVEIKQEREVASEIESGII